MSIYFGNKEVKEIWIYQDIDMPIYQVTNDMALYIPLNEATQAEDISIGKTYTVTNSNIEYGFYNGVSSAIVKGELSARLTNRVGNSYSFWAYIDTTTKPSENKYLFFNGWLRVFKRTDGKIELMYPSGSSYSSMFFIESYTGWTMITLRCAGTTLYATAYLKDGSKIEITKTTATLNFDGFASGRFFGDDAYTDGLSNFVIYHGETGGIPIEQSVFDGLYEQVKSYYGH